MKITSNLVITTALVAALAVACGKKEDASGDKKSQLADLKKQQTELTAKIKQLEKEIGATTTVAGTDKTKLVSLTSITLQPFAHFIEVQGKVESDKYLTVSALSGGTLTRVYVKKGDKVAKGQLLAQIDSDILLKSIDEVKNQLAFATEVYNKQAALWEQKIGTEIQFLSAKNNKESLEKRIVTLKEQLDLNQVKSPVDGVIDNVFRKEGEMAGPGLPVFQLVNSKELKVTAEVAESYLGSINQGDKVEISFPDLSKTINGRITTIGSIINPVTRSFTVEIYLGSSVGQIKPNMLSILKINDYSNSNAVVVPLNVIQNSPDGKFVFVANGNKAEKRIVDVKNTYQGKAEVASGLKANEQLITVGHSDLTDGEAIKY